MSSSKLLLLDKQPETQDNNSTNNETTKQNNTQLVGECNSGDSPEDENWIAVKPIENDPKNEIVNIVSLSVDCDKVL